MASSYNISTFQGDYLQLNLAVKDSSSSNPINLSGYEIRGEVRNGFGSTGVLLDLNPIIINAVSGLISITVPSIQTQDLPVNTFYYDIERYPSGIETGNSIKLLKGKFIVHPEVTKA